MGSKLLALRGVTLGDAGAIFVKISVTYFLNSPEPILGTIDLRPSKTIKGAIGYHLRNIDKIFPKGLQSQTVSLKKHCLIP